METEMKTCLLITSISFILLFIYYVSVKPDYVLDQIDHKLSIMLCTIYSLMFSSALGIAYCLVNAITKGEKSNVSKIKVESPTFS